MKTFEGYSPVDCLLNWEKIVWPGKLFGTLLQMFFGLRNSWASKKIDPLFGGFTLFLLGFFFIIVFFYGK